MGLTLKWLRIIFNTKQLIEQFVKKKKNEHMHLSINLDGLIGLSNSQFAIAIQVYYHIKT